MLMNKYGLFIVLCLLAIGISSNAQETEATYPIDRKYRVCVDSNSSTLGMLECISAATKEWDEQLNKYYKLLAEKLNQTQKASLRTTQREWLVYKEKETRFYLDLYTEREGTIWNVVMARRGMDLIRQRAIELIEYYETISQN